MKTFIRQLIFNGALALCAMPVVTRAHCDTLDGPVIAAARVALSRSDVTPVLMWVQPADEAAIRAAFDRVLAVRAKSTEVTEFADTWFFETLVRIHRAGEGAPYTGLKPGEPGEPGIAAADAALASGRADEVLAQTAAPLEAALKAKFARVRALQAHAQHSVAAGREYVAAYVDYVHFVEQLVALAGRSAVGAPSEHRH